MNVVDILRDPGGALRKVIRKAVDRQPVVLTPHQWADAGGLYATRTDGWLYQQLPDRVLREPGHLEELLNTFAKQLPGRQVHLLVHAWEYLADPDPATPPRLAAFQKDTLAFLTPVRTASVGVQLTAAPSATSVKAQIHTAVDELLGEDIPDLGGYDEDRERVLEALQAVGARPLPRHVANFMECWYTLGTVTDVDVTEYDDMVLLDEGRIEMVGAGPLTGDVEAASLPNPGERGAIVLSIRGTLAEAAEATTRRGVLMRASVVYGRRAVTPLSPLSMALRSMPNVSPRPLPLRQLDALDETLPCSTRRLDPTHQKVGADQLRALGFADITATGALSGLLIGPGGPTMTRPVLVNPLAGGGVMAALGDPGSGRSFLTQVLTFQANLGGFRTAYLTGTGRTGGGLARLSGTAALAPGSPGELEALRWVPAAEALALWRELLRSLELGLTEEESAGLDAGFARAVHAPQQGLDTVLRLADSTTAVAKVMRALRRDPTLAVLLGSGPSQQLPDSALVGLHNVAPGAARATAAATLLRHVALRDTTPALVALDDFSGTELSHPALRGALARTAGRSTSVVVVARTVEDLPPEIRAAGHRFVLSTTDEQSVEFIGTAPTPELMAWLRQASPGQGDHPLPSGLYRGPEEEAPVGFQSGPWPDPVVTALTPR